MKILIAYYSHSANTKKLADIIAKIIKEESQNSQRKHTRQTTAPY